MDQFVMPIANAPEALRELIIRKPAKERSGARSAAVPLEGNRNNTFASFAGSLRRKGMAGEQIVDALHAYNDQLPTPLPSDEVERIGMGMERYASVPELSEQGMASFFASRLQEKLRFSPTRGWFHYTGTHWKEDTDAVHVQEHAKQLVDDMWQFVQNDQRLSAGDRDTLSKQCRGLRRKMPIRNIAELAKSDPLLLDEDPWDEPAGKLNFLNGTLDLNTIELRPHNPSDRITRVLPFAYDAEAACPNFDRALGDALDQETGEFLLRVCGAALYGAGGLQHFLLLTGPGQNGKSTVMNGISAAFGVYTTTAEPSTLIKSVNKPSINNDVAALCGARLVVTSELSSGQVLDAALVKRMTGGDKIKARFLYGEFFEFTPIGLFVMVTNFPPVFDGSDSAMVRRILAIPFENIIAPQNLDPMMIDKVKREQSGIMNRLLRGLSQYQQSGLQIPDTVKAHSAKLTRDCNQVQQFLDDRCVVDPGARTGAAALFSAYRTWAYDAALKPMSERGFKAALERTIGREQERDRNSRFWSGIALTMMTETR